ncbi:hypothetical protein BDW74DRAFT_30493 [Aspergillus multicolor]|uniref:uncharacterized protein n=1 Tax=Aspergillus multicolor TaxID=41759 RepID=UPI003CCD0649
MLGRRLKTTAWRRCRLHCIRRRSHLQVRRGRVGALTWLCSSLEIRRISYCMCRGTSQHEGILSLEYPIVKS